MSKQDNLTDFLVDVADAIREKKGTTEKINPQNFSDEIRNLPSGGEVNTFGEVMVDSNGNGSYKIREITVKSGVTYIQSDAYRSFANLTDIYFPDTVVQLGSSCFRDCTSLETVVLPKSIKTISNMVFYGCRNFKLLDCRNLLDVPTLGSSVFTVVPQIVVPYNLYDKWKSATNWSTYADRIVKASEYQPNNE